LRILFIGNSYTYVNDLPHLFAELANAGQHKVKPHSGGKHHKLLKIARGKFIV